MPKHNDTLTITYSQASSIVVALREAAFKSRQDNCNATANYYMAMSDEIEDHLRNSGYWTKKAA